MGTPIPFLVGYSGDRGGVVSGGLGLRWWFLSTSSTETVEADCVSLRPRQCRLVRGEVMRVWVKLGVDLTFLYVCFF